VDRSARCDALLALGAALVFTRAPMQVAEEVAPDALALAEALGDRRRASAACQLALRALIAFGSETMWADPRYRRWADAADRYAAPDSVERMNADAALNDLAAAAGDTAAARAIATRVLTLARRLGTPQLVFGAVVNFLGVPPAPCHVDEHVQVAREFARLSGDGIAPPLLGRVRHFCSLVVLDEGDRDEVERLWAEVERLDQQQNSANLRLRTLLIQGERSLLDGRLEAAVAICGRIVVLAEELGVPATGRLWAMLVASRPLLHLGRYGETLAIIPEDAWQAAAWRALCLAHLSRGQEATQELDRLLRRQIGGLAMMSIRDLVRALETAILLRDRQLVGRLVTALAPVATLAHADHAHTCVARHLGDAARFLGEYDTARTRYEQALDVTARARFRPEAALARLGLAEVMLHGGPEERHTAPAHLNRAAEELAAMGMEPAYHRAAALLEQVEAASPTYPAGLSAREVEVLRLLAAGASNREIAQELTVSVRTVGHHVEHIYQKIGAHGRVEATAFALGHGLL
jgi:DNA-binding CsgD family transcriptional regulator